MVLRGLVAWGGAEGPAWAADAAFTKGLSRSCNRYPAVDPVSLRRTRSRSLLLPSEPRGQ